MALGNNRPALAAIADDGSPGLNRQASTESMMSAQPSMGSGRMQATNTSGGAPAGSARQLARIEQQLGQLGMFTQGSLGQMQVQMMQLQAGLETVRSESVKNADTVTKQIKGFYEQLERLDKRTDRIDRSMDMMRNSLADADFDLMNKMPQKVVDAVSVQVARQMKNPNCSPNDNGEPLRGTPQFHDKQFEGTVKELATQVADVLAVVQRQQEMLNMLWRIDAGVREIRQGGARHHAYDEDGGSPGRQLGSPRNRHLASGSDGLQRGMNDSQYTKRSGMSGTVMSKPPHGQ